MTIVSLAEKFNSLNTDKIINESLNETKDEFKSINKEQLRAGKTNTGKNIAPKYRSKKYALAKNQMNPLPGLGNPDLHLTGAFY